MHFFERYERVLFLLAIVVVLSIVFGIRLWNWVTYTTWWADDGGGHIAYIDTLIEDKRLPFPDETYLAWHEPGYYAFIALWQQVGELFGMEDLLNWNEFPQIIIFASILVILWLFVRDIIDVREKERRWLGLLIMLMTGVLFVGVKLSAYVTNELLIQFGILLLVYLFFRWKLFERDKTRYIFLWGLLLALFLWVKLTVIIVAIAAVMIWMLYALMKGKWYPLLYVLLIVCIVMLSQASWFIYKQQTFGKGFSINLYEEEKQSLVQSEAWGYIFEINTTIVRGHPYWFYGDHSFATILIADSFGDYYNLFSHVDLLNGLPAEQKQMVLNGRYTTHDRLQAMIWVNRVGVVLTFLWIIGFLGYMYRLVRKRWKDEDWYVAFFLLMVVGGIGALVYNNVRMPYLARGVLKAQFVFFMFPLIIAFAYVWWWKVLRKPWLRVVILLLPILVYLWVGRSVLLVL